MELLAEFFIQDEGDGVVGRDAHQIREVSTVERVGTFCNNSSDHVAECVFAVVLAMFVPSGVLLASTDHLVWIGDKAGYSLASDCTDKYISHL